MDSLDIDAEADLQPSPTQGVGATARSRVLSKKNLLRAIQRFLPFSLSDPENGDESKLPDWYQKSEMHSDFGKLPEWHFKMKVFQVHLYWIGWN